VSPQNQLKDRGKDWRNNGPHIGICSLKARDGIPSHLMKTRGAPWLFSFSAPDYRGAVDHGQRIIKNVWNARWQACA